MTESWHFDEKNIQISTSHICTLFPTSFCKSYFPSLSLRGYRICV